MLVTGLVLVGAIVVAVACGSSDKKDDNSKTPAVATQTAAAKATLVAGGTSPASSDGNGKTEEARPTLSVPDRATAQASAVQDEKTQNAYDRETEQSEGATSDARDATRSASRDKTQQQHNGGTVVPNTN